MCTDDSGRPIARLSRATVAAWFEMTQGLLFLSTVQARIFELGMVPARVTRTCLRMSSL